MKKNKNAIVLKEGDVGIPFTAVRESYRYRAFVTRLSPDCNIEIMNRHIDTKLNVNATVKVVSKPGSPVLSIVLYFTSESDSLDLKMRGLWPKGTGVFKYKPAPKDKSRFSQRASGSGPPEGPRQSDHPHMHRSNTGSRGSTPINQTLGNGYTHNNREQRQLNDQWRDQ